MHGVIPNIHGQHENFRTFDTSTFVVEGSEFSQFGFIGCRTSVAQCVLELGTKFDTFSTDLKIHIRHSRAFFLRQFACKGMRSSVPKEAVFMACTSFSTWTTLFQSAPTMGEIAVACGLDIFSFGPKFC